MPHVIVTANRSHEALSDDEVLVELGRLLRGLVAGTLSCIEPGGDLTDVRSFPMSAPYTIAFSQGD